MGILKDVIRESGLQYKQVGELCGLSTGHVCADVYRERVSAEKAIIYGRALQVDPARLCPESFKPGEMSLTYTPRAVSMTPPTQPPPEAPPQAAPKRRRAKAKRAEPVKNAAPVESVDARPSMALLSGRSLQIKKVLGKN